MEQFGRQGAKGAHGMASGDGATDVERLIGRVVRSGEITERMCGAAIDAAESDPDERVGTIECLEVIEATLAYHRSSLTATKGSERGLAGITRDARANGSMVERLMECGLRLRALTFLYLFLGTAARAIGRVELAEQAERYRRDVVDLGGEIDRCLIERSGVTRVINDA